jgi:hypothetical protein
MLGNNNPFHTDRPEVERMLAQMDAASFDPAQDAWGPQDDGVMLINGADLTPQPVRWAWPGWLAQGKLHILAGPPSQGKTTIALAIGATITTAGRWPDGSRCAEVGNVLVWSAEDDPADTLLPRLLAAGAERSRCYFVRGRRVAGEERSFDPAQDMPALELEARRIGGARLLVVDPVVSAVAGDSHKNTEVRRALQPIVDLASRLDAIVLGISHLSKGPPGGDPLQRLTGSIAFGALPRVVLMTGECKAPAATAATATATATDALAPADWHDPGASASASAGAAQPQAQAQHFVLVRNKSNLGPTGGGLEYQIAQTQPLPGIVTNSIVWGRAVQGTPRDLLSAGAAAEDEAGGKSALAEAMDFVREVLGDDLVPCNSVTADATNAGIAGITLRRAVHQLGVIKTKGKTSGTWFWKLPKR